MTNKFQRATMCIYDLWNVTIDYNVKCV